jgi:5'(3')-deoxyribonucleotidase
MDIDEVFLDFATPMFEIIERLFGRRLTHHDYTVWDMFSIFNSEEKKLLFAEIGKEGFARSLRPIPGAVEALAELRTFVDVFAVTSHFPSPTWVYERDEMLSKEHGFDRRHIVHTSSKFLIATDAFLDDNPGHVEAWVNEHPLGLGMLWHIPNTRTLTQYDHLRVRSWEEVVNNMRALDKRRNVYELLEEREFEFSDNPREHSTCNECGKKHFGTFTEPRHEPNCALGKVIDWWRRKA